MRIVKEHDVRRMEIILATEKLFHTKGYERCTINDILKEVGIAKGTFYHYFISKEDALNAVVAKGVNEVIEKVENGLRDLREANSNPIEQLMGVFLAMRMTDEYDDQKLENLHRADNALLHQKNLSELIRVIAPILATIVQEGIECNTWQCEYPLEYMNIFLAASLTLTDGGIFQVDEVYQQRTMCSLISILEKMLSLPNGMLLSLYHENW